MQTEEIEMIDETEDRAARVGRRRRARAWAVLLAVVAVGAVAGVGSNDDGTQSSGPASRPPPNHVIPFVTSCPPVAGVGSVDG